MRAFLHRCGQALVMGSICAAFLCAALSYLLGFIGCALNECSTGLELLSDHLWNNAARKRRSE